MRKLLLAAFAATIALGAPARALVRMDEGRREIMGIQLLQDRGDHLEASG